MFGREYNEVLYRHYGWEVARLRGGHEYMVTAFSISPMAPRTSENLRN